MRYVAYYRVSTFRQGQSGLGLEGQRTAVADHLEAGDEVVAEFTEIESGRKDDRPKLAEAIATAKRLKATLVIAKLDRLARSAHVVSCLLETGVKFVACDQPSASHLTIRILAAVAHEEAEMISRRTKAALGAAKARGAKLGNLATLDAHRARGSQTVALEARRRALNVMPLIEKLRADGYTTLSALARELTVRRVEGKQWDATQVKRVLRSAA